MVKRYQNRQAADLKYDFITPAIWYQYLSTVHSADTFCPGSLNQFKTKTWKKLEPALNLLDQAVRE